MIVRSCKYVARFVTSFTGCTSLHSNAPNGAQVRSALGVKRKPEQEEKVNSYRASLLQP